MTDGDCASTSKAALVPVLEYCRTVPLYINFQGGKATVTEEEVATQILAPLLNQIAYRHPSKELQSSRRTSGASSHGSLQIAVGERGVRMGEEAAQNIIESKGDGGCGEKAEVWEAGAVAYELLVGQPPTAVPAAPPTGLVRQGSFLGFLGFLSDDCVDFLQAALRENARERPTATECLRHPWLSLHTAKQQASGKGEMALASNPDLSPNPLWLWAPGVATFASPSHSLSPAMATWKIPTKVEGSRPGSGSSSLDAYLGPPSPVQSASTSPDSEDEAQDILPRISLLQGGDLPASKICSSFVDSQGSGEAQTLTDSIVDSS